MENQKVISSVEKGCLECLNYFAFFNYPLTAKEVHIFNTAKSSINETEEALNKLVSRQEITKLEDFYLTTNDASWVTDRKKGNKRAHDLLNRSVKYVKIIACFPFVRGIAISGSLSKFYASENADIDYFIITQKNRLWIARTLLHLFKKLTFITGHQHYFCMNYFVDTSALKITHQNLYSAIETVTLLPVVNESLMDDFTDQNQWTKNFLPNHPLSLRKDFLVKNEKYPFKYFFESIFNLVAPGKLNRFLMQLTDRKWRRKWKNHGYTEEEYVQAFQTETSISKNHPADYQKKVLDALDNEQSNSKQAT